MADTDGQENNERSVYEVAFHIDANLSETEVRKTFDSVKEAITTLEGTVFAEALPVRMNLAYCISRIHEGSRRDHTSAHFAWVAYELAPELQEKVDEALKTDLGIIRYLITSTTKEAALYAQDKAAEKRVMPETEAVSDKELDEVLEETTA